MSKMKKADKKANSDNGVSADPSVAPANDASEKANCFNEYPVGHLPVDARPLKSAAYKGRHSYTVSLGGAAAQPSFVCDRSCYFVRGLLLEHTKIIHTGYDKRRGPKTCACKGPWALPR